MSQSHFNYTHKGKSNQNGVIEDIYTFKCSLNVTYIVEVENHPNDIFILKFFQKNHRHSKDRYSLTNTRKFLKRKNKSGTENFLKILNTILDISLTIYRKNKKASFGFMGAPTIKELDKNKSTKTINNDGTVEETTRFNIYSIYVKRYFSPKYFIHIEIKSSSCYMLKSVKNTSLNTENIEHFFKQYITDYC